MRHFQFSLLTAPSFLFLVFVMLFLPTRPDATPAALTFRWLWLLFLSGIVAREAYLWVRSRGGSWEFARKLFHSRVDWWFDHPAWVIAWSLIYVAIVCGAAIMIMRLTSGGPCPR
jgi:hypothetical protein